MADTEKTETICVDFDGVLHSYVTPYDKVPKDPPTEGAIEWLKELLASEFDVAILSTRNLDDGGPKRIQDWLKENGLTDEEVKQLEFWRGKDRAKIYIDDRGYHFDGANFPSLKQLRQFEPHNKEVRDAMRQLQESTDFLKDEGFTTKDIVKFLSRISKKKTSK